MSHMIEGNKCFFTGQPAWHKLGIVLTDAPSIDDAWRIAYPHEMFDVENVSNIGGIIRQNQSIINSHLTSSIPFNTR